MRAAAIDVGSNTIKITIAEKNPQGDFQILAKDTTLSRLGKGVDATGRLSPEARQKALHAIGEQVKLARMLEVDKLRVVATSAVRDAQNREEFVEEIKSSLGVQLEILSGEEEGQLSYNAVAQDPLLHLGCDEIAVIDIGGGSTEFAFGKEGKINFATSVRIGAVRLTERILKSDPPTSSEIREARTQAREAILAAIRSRKVNQVAGVGGSMVNLARILESLPQEKTESVHGMKIRLSDLQKLLEILYSRTTAERKELIGIDPLRADIIVAGAIILEQALLALDTRELILSNLGLRYGILFELLEIEG